MSDSITYTPAKIHKQSQACKNPRIANDIHSTTAPGEQTSKEHVSKERKTTYAHIINMTIACINSTLLCIADYNNKNNIKLTNKAKNKNTQAILATATITRVQKL
jgi:hypothetical protein